MSIQKIAPNGANFTTRILKNKKVLKVLEKISEHGTSFAAGTSLVMALGVRPLAISATPDTEKENKQHAIANSMSSGLMKFAIVESIALPIENAVKRIDQNPEKFLKKYTIENLKQGENLTNSKSYKLITQTIKLGVGFITAIPKSVLTVALIPIFMDKLFKNSPQISQKNAIKPIEKQEKEVSFSGIPTQLSKGVGKLIDQTWLQKFAKKFQNKDQDIAKHMTAATDILLTTTSAYQTANSKKIKENRKKVLIYNNIISTAITIGAMYGIDRIAKKRTQKFIEKFKQINLGDPKLNKYIEGINILRPAIIAAGVYYGLLPIFSTYMAEKIDKYIEKTR